MNSPKTEGIRNIPSSIPLATTRHFTRAEIACERSARIRIQTTLPMKIAVAIHKLDLNHSNPSKYDWRKNNNIWGTQVIRDRSINSTDIFPMTYSVRENGRHRYKGNALFLRSRDTKGGPTSNVTKNAKPPWRLTKVLKNEPSIGTTSRTLIFMMASALTL